MGTPRLTSLGWSRRPSSARGVKRGGSQRAEFGSGGARCQPLSPHKEGVTIGTTPRDTGGESRPNPRDGRKTGNGKKMGKVVVKNKITKLSKVLKMNQNERKFEALEHQTLCWFYIQLIASNWLIGDHRETGKERLPNPTGEFNVLLWRCWIIPSTEGLWNCFVNQSTSAASHPSTP